MRLAILSMIQNEVRKFAASLIPPNFTITPINEVLLCRSQNASFALSNQDYDSLSKAFFETTL